MTGPETIWIIGATEGIGAALAREWAARGNRLILSARSAVPLRRFATELGPEHIPLPLDVGRRDSLEAAAKDVSRTGPLDRIVHLAALYDPGKVGEVDPERAAKIIDVNLTGSFYVARTAPRLLRAGGQLALCGSIAGYIGLPQGQIYSATKAGVISLAESLRAELAGRIDVRLINPGFVDTRMTRRNDFTMPAMIPPEEAARAIISGLNARRFEVHFPRRLTWPLKLLAAIPYRLSMPLTRRLVR